MEGTSIGRGLEGTSIGRGLEGLDPDLVDGSDVNWKGIGNDVNWKGIGRVGTGRC